MGSPAGWPQLRGSMSSQSAAEELASLVRLPTSLAVAEMDATACMGLFAGGSFSPELDAAGDMDKFPGGLGLMGFSGEGFLCPDSPAAAAYMESLLPAGFLPVEYCPAAAPPAASEREESQKQANNKRRRAVLAAAPDGASAAGSPAPVVSGSNISTEEKPKKKDRKVIKRPAGRCGGKDEEETPKEVVHVRARRGQATDSHSLAERVRREKINEKMRCLQGLVPGCYKAMGMAVMLDEIINYVQSLQNQVEFLSMKLSAASAVYDFNQELDSSVVMPQTLPRAVGEGDEAQEMDRLMKEGLGRSISFHPTMPF